MRFVKISFVLLSVVVFAGCTSSALVKPDTTQNGAGKQRSLGSFFKETLGKGQASDPRARDIEQRLGYSKQLGY